MAAERIRRLFLRIEEAPTILETPLHVAASTRDTHFRLPSQIDSQAVMSQKRDEFQSQKCLDMLMNYYADTSWPKAIPIIL